MQNLISYEPVLDLYKEIINTYIEIPTNLLAYQLKKQFPNYANIATLASLIATLQKSEQKLPTYFANRCAIPALLYEQCTAEQTAQLKYGFEGDTMLDATFGLGVDALYFSQFFTQISACELQPDFVTIGNYNLNRLNTQNISLHLKDIEAYLTTVPTKAFDLIYLDPARRTQTGQKLSALTTLSPNVLALLPGLCQKAKTILIKLSPLFSVQEVFRYFMPYLRAVYVLAVEQECKELLVELDTAFANNDQTNDTTINARFIRKNKIYSFSKSFNQLQTNYFLPTVLSIAQVQTFQYLYLPDVSIQVAGLSAAYLQDALGGDAYTTFQAGFGLSNTLVPDFGGSIYQIRSCLAYQPRVIQRYIQVQNITRLNVSHRYFSQSVKTIRQNIRLPIDGGAHYLFFTRLAEKQLVAIHCVRLS